VTREEIARRNFTEGTTRAYLRVRRDLVDYFQRPPERLTPEQIRQYTAHLFTARKLSANTVNQMVGALRFFYLTVLNKRWRGHEMPYPKKNMHLPVIWSPGRDRPSDPSSTDVLPHHPDDPVCHRHAPGRGGCSEDHRRRLGSHGAARLGR
jgi:hypothetical protein